MDEVVKVLLVFAGISESGFNKTGKPLRLVWINHGLASLASSAKAAGYDVSLVDLRQLSSWDDFRSEVKTLSPEVVGITMMSVDFDAAMEAARIAKSVRSDMRVVVGGPHPSIMPEEVSSNSYVDHIIVGEGETSFVKLLDDIEGGRKPERVIVGEHPDLDKLPFIDRELFGCPEMPIDSFLEKPFVTLIAGRGCIYNCSFCQPAERNIFGKKVRRRSVANIIEELKALRDRYDFQSFMFHDDCLAEDKRWVMEFCEAYMKNRFKKPFVCQCRADIICKNEDMVRLMRRAGLAMLLIGFESGNQRILKFLRKGTTVEMNYKAAKICKKLGIRIWANYMLGIPTETKEEALDTVEMIRRIKPYRPSPAFFTPHPGSDLYEYCVKNGLSLIKSHSDYSRSPNAPKIKGIDYVFLHKALLDSKAKSLSVRLARKIDFIKERRVKHGIRKILKLFKRR